MFSMTRTDNNNNIRNLYSALSWRSKHLTTLCGGLCQTAYLGANCRHAVHNLIKENSRIHRCPPQVRTQMKCLSLFQLFPLTKALFFLAAKSKYYNFYLDITLDRHLKVWWRLLTFFGQNWHSHQVIQHSSVAIILALWKKNKVNKNKHLTQQQQKQWHLVTKDTNVFLVTNGPLLILCLKLFYLFTNLRNDTMQPWFYVSCYAEFIRNTITSVVTKLCRISRISNFIGSCWHETLLF